MAKRDRHLIVDLLCCNLISTAEAATLKSRGACTPTEWKRCAHQMHCCCTVVGEEKSITAVGAQHIAVEYSTPQENGHPQKDLHDPSSSVSAWDCNVQSMLRNQRNRHPCPSQR